MAQGGAFSHRGFKQRATAIGCFMPYRTVAKSLAYNYGNADPAARAFTSWLTSPKHRQVMEDTRFTHTGLAVAKISNGRYFLRSYLFCPVRHGQLAQKFSV